ncbi:MAG: hypothetical protein A3A96_03135 [Candidatus Zambryskibacteria bacterium RIFCSPLOWO2_01_FULL_39_39]|uniref:Uncharacterized protein n=1 Tax=Candidatus Zambryskibacteria bacterium RIFCSPLOWO2_01_FULL_39_39 TaxID=1802758 RepID=A0A1G2TWE7_9BACT|nr:MAG: hypothetical protein UT00_C0008G0005 [Parcubacteria group bacterium GW2011_GWA1_38_7]OHA87653.1 MAG: hypothetical protein A2644_02525 [Candidatus Zambryskibacteria bacterium RIFCSPHIGHO2_01_FULL_39_63]OHA94411.1 MAG: hypothetical protein A3B88_01790 [Candidatus Zambryskibacteria bacterium RIFCSPHIGHO2_02_FULL_39_19]OHA98777.1 MAG: hypothetical protein A3F20_00820 [Candidatus Zambryskibacteria bacterium RIFCSPHIGHO2_12_FULL_39_21]OHB01635.1 MAG: hypothetical protein A3A96_03135 [Candidat
MDENSAQQNQTVLRRPVRPIPQEVAPRKMRIKIWMGWALIISAICVDLVELLGGYISFEIIATIVGWVASFVFWVWFLILGVPYSSNTKKFVMAIIMNLLEIIPGLDAIPVWFLWTLGMVTIVGMVRMEDKGEKPSIIGGFLEGFALAETLNPVALPIAIGTTGLNRARRFVKRKAGVGQANWVKQDEETDNADTAMGSIDG